MTSDPAPKRSDDETEAETVKRRLIETVREQFDEIAQRPHSAETEVEDSSEGAA